MPSTLDWKSSEDTRDIVHLVVQALVEGRRVALPVENAYHAVYSGLNSSSVDHIQKLKQDKRASECCLLLRSSQELLDYVPELSVVASRIAARAWPGPLILDLPVSVEVCWVDCLRRFKTWSFAMVALHFESPRMTRSAKLYG